jgi:hypothetical protein
MRHSSASALPAAGFAQASGPLGGSFSALPAAGFAQASGPLGGSLARAGERPLTRGPRRPRGGVAGGVRGAAGAAVQTCRGGGRGLWGVAT